MTFTESVTVVRLGPSRLGDAGPPSRHVVEGCFVAPQASTETAQYSSTTSTVWELFAPAGSDVRSTDKVEVRGVVWNVTGEPEVWRSPFTSWAPGMRVVLTRVRG